MTEEVYKTIKCQLDSNFKDIPTIGVFNSQFDYLEEGNQTPFSFPCLFIGVDNDPEYVPESRGIMRGFMDLSIYLGVEMYNTQIGSEDMLFNSLSLKKRVTNVLEQFSVEGCIDPMTKVSESVDQNHPNYYVYKVVFRCEFLEYLDSCETKIEDWSFRVNEGQPYPND